MGFKVSAVELIAGAAEVLHGFPIEDDRGASILTFVYTNSEEADARKTQVRTILQNALLVRGVTGTNHSDANPSWYPVASAGSPHDSFLRGFTINGEDGAAILNVAYRVEDVGARIAQLQLILNRAFLVIDRNGKNHPRLSVEWWTPIA